MRASRARERSRSSHIVTELAEAISQVGAGADWVDDDDDALARDDRVGCKAA